MKPKISILLTTCNLLNHTKECLKSLAPSLKKDYELIIVDNNSTYDTQKYLMTGNISLPSWLPVQLQLNKKNLGVSGALNQGMRMAKSDYLYWLHNDVILDDPEFFEKLYSNFQVYKKVGAVAALTNYVANPYQQWSNPLSLPNNVLSVNFINNTSTMFSKKAWKDTGGFDEGYIFGNWEDNDYCMRLREKGYQILVDGNAFIHHKGSLTYKEEKLFKTLKQNKERFIKKWGEPPKPKICMLIK